MVLLTFKRLCTALKIWPCLTAAFLIATAIASPSDTAQKLAEREQPLADAAATSTAESTAPHFPVYGGGNYFSNPEPVALWTGQTSIRDLIGPIALRNANKLFQGFLRTPGVWPKVANVTTTRPFIFFHQRKAGGSSIRATLHAGAKKNNLKSYIPCLSSEKKLRCDTYTLPEKLTAKNAAVIYGGHIPWGEPQNKYERFLHH